MAGWVRCGGRREPVPGGLAAASMPRTLPQTGPTPPSTVFRDLSERHSALVGVDLGRHGRCTPCVDAVQSIVEIFEFDGDSSTHGVDPSDRGNLSEVGRCRSAECPRHGCRGQAPMDGFTASPHSDTAPPTRGMPAFAVEVAGQRPALPQVQGAALPKNTHKKTAGRGLLFRCNGAPGEIRTPDRLVRSQVLYPTELRAPIT